MFLWVLNPIFLNISSSAKSSFHSNYYYNNFMYNVFIKMVDCICFHLKFSMNKGWHRETFLWTDGWIFFDWFRKYGRKSTACIYSWVESTFLWSIRYLTKPHNFKVVTFVNSSKELIWRFISIKERNHKNMKSAWRCLTNQWKSHLTSTKQWLWPVASVWCHFTRIKFFTHHKTNFSHLEIPGKLNWFLCLISCYET